MVLIIHMLPNLTKGKIVDALRELGLPYSDASWYAEEVVTRGNCVIGRGDYDRLEPFRAALENKGFYVTIEEV